MVFPEPPVSFLAVRVHDLSCTPSICALCAGYEGGEWRASQLADHAMEWLPEFCLSFDEITSLSSSNALKLIRKAARLVYQTDNYKNRGEFGELFLHIILRQVYGSIPAIQKIYFKDSANSTVKGFDSVHVIERDGKFELWIGEVKFYSNAARAIIEVIKEIVEHTAIDYIKNEKIFISNMLSQNHPFYSKLKQLLDQNTSIDDLFDCACIPILITYNSKVVKSHNKRDDEYSEKIEKEVLKIRNSLEKRLSTVKLPPIQIHLFLLPLKDKDTLVEQMDKKLKGLQ